MAGMIFIETLRRGWRQATYWGIAFAILALYVIAIIPDMEVLQQYIALIETLPPAIVNMMGVSDAAVFSTPEGFIAAGFFIYVILVLGVYAVLLGLNITANDEDNGTLDVLLALPIPRWRVIVERFAASVVFLILIAILSYIGMVAGMFTTTIELNMGVLLQVTLNMLSPLLVMMAFTVLATALFRRKAIATALAAGFIIGSFFINLIGAVAQDTLMGALRGLSVFYYADNERLILNGLQVGDVAVLLVATAACLIGAIWFFERRDVGV